MTTQLLRLKYAVFLFLTLIEIHLFSAHSYHFYVDITSRSCIKRRLLQHKAYSLILGICHLVININILYNTAACSGLFENGVDNNELVLIV